jgi:hypothetical protein
MHWLGSIKYMLLFMFTFSYHGSLRHYTLDRLSEFERHQHDHKVVRSLLQTFKRLKVEELQLVRKGLRLTSPLIKPLLTQPFLSGSFISCYRYRNILLANVEQGLLAQPTVLV